MYIHVYIFHTQLCSAIFQAVNQTFAALQFNVIEILRKEEVNKYFLKTIILKLIYELLYIIKLRNINLIFLDNLKPCRVMSTGISRDEQGYISIPSSEDENEDEANDKDYCPESAEEFPSSEISSDDESNQLVKLYLLQTSTVYRK